MDHFRIVLLGKTGVGKSAAGNTILGKKAFEEKCSPESVTRECVSNTVIVDGQKITVIDTPGLYDTSMKKRDLKSKIAELFNHSDKGIHAILLVIKLNTKFTEEERNAVQWIKDNFGEQGSKNTIVLFTNGDDLDYSGMEITKYINEGKELKKLIDDCFGRYHVFKNRSNDRKQVSELLVKIRQMIQEYNYSLYTKKKYEDTQKKLFMANVAGVLTGGVAGAGVAGGTAAWLGYAKAVATGVAVLGGAGTATVAGMAGVGAAVYKYCKSESSTENKNKGV